MRFEIEETQPAYDNIPHPKSKLENISSQIVSPMKENGLRRNSSQNGIGNKGSNVSPFKRQDQNGKANYRQHFEPSNKKSMQQSHSAFDILRHNAHERSHSGMDFGEERRLTNKLHDLQSGDNWSCMWLNHFNREQEQMNKRTQKYAMNTQMILSNPTRFGSGANNLSELKKQQMQTIQLGTGCGNEFVTGMSGCPIQKVHKLKKKKRDKLTKYLIQNSNFSQNYDKKTLLQNGNGVSINTTPDYRYAKVLDPQRKSFCEDIKRQIKTNREKVEHQRKINRDEDVKTSRLYDQKMKIVEHLQQINRDKIKKALRDDINWQIRQKMNRSYCG